MRSRIVAVLICTAAAVSLGAGSGRQEPQPPAPVPEYTPPEVQQLAGRTVRTYSAPEASQGVAVDGRHFYAIDNTIIAKYETATGRGAGRWAGPRNGPVRHLNSCLADRGRLWCANSNYPLTPMASSVEIFESGAMTHADSISLGMLDEGSLTWLDRFRGGWLAGFSHYDKTGGVGFKGHVFSSVVAFDREWRRNGGWLFPASVLDRMAPYASSGGAIGPDGWLYLLGHDRPELYVVGRPTMGPTLVHLATVAIESAGQAFSWGEGRSRTIYTIDRQRRLVRTIDVPEVPVSRGIAVPFR